MSLLPSSESVNSAQERLQDTTTVADCSSSDSDGDVPETEKNEDIPKATCSGDGGCGNDFPRDEHGSDFQFAMLCSTCYKREINDEETFPEKSPLSLSRPPPANKEATETSQPKDVPDEDSETAQPKDVPDETTVITNKKPAVADVEKSEDNDLMTDGKDCGMDDAIYDGSGECGLEMGIVLRNARDINLAQYDVLAGRKELVFEPYINDQDNISKKIRKFWNTIPNTTPVLYGFKNYQAMLNTRSKRGWIGHCRLTSTAAGAQGNAYVLWEIWETRCNVPRYDGVVINEKGDVILIQHIEKWLNDNALSSDLKLDYDHEWYER